MSSEASRPSLPLELVHLIIRHFAEPPRPEAYELPLDQRIDLTICCLVNRTWKAIAHPLLFVRVSLSSYEALKGFAQAAASTGLARFTERLGVFEAADPKADNLHDLCAVRMLCICLRSCYHIKGLLLDRNFRRFTPEEGSDDRLTRKIFKMQVMHLRWMLQGLGRLEELIDVKGDGQISFRRATRLGQKALFWADEMPCLRRICFFNPCLDEGVLEQLARLDKVLVLRYCDLDEPRAPFEDINQIENIWLIGPADPYASWLSKYPVSHIRRRIPFDGTDKEGFELVRSRARAGTLWDVPPPEGRPAALRADAPAPAPAEGPA